MSLGQALRHPIIYLTTYRLQRAEDERVGYSLRELYKHSSKEDLNWLREHDRELPCQKKESEE